MLSASSASIPGTDGRSKGVFEQAKFNLTDAVRPAFGRIFERVVTFLMR